MDKYSADMLSRDLDEGAYAWPGGYPRYFVMGDCEALCFKCAKENKSIIRRAIRRNDDKQWQVMEVQVNWEDSNLQCSNCYEDIETAYGE